MDFFYGESHVGTLIDLFQMIIVIKNLLPWFYWFTKLKFICVLIRSVTYILTVALFLGLLFLPVSIPCSRWGKVERFCMDSASKIWTGTKHISQPLLGVWCCSCLLPLLFAGIKLYLDLFEFVLVGHSLVSRNSYAASTSSIDLLQQCSDKISVLFFQDASCSLSIYHLHFCHVGAASLSSILFLEKFDERSILLLEVVLM